MKQSVQSFSQVAIDYDHDRNEHSLEGPSQVFARLIPGTLPSSVLDVGCGTGTWLRAALDAGVRDVLGIDGVDIPAHKLLIPAENFIVRDLTTPIDLGRHFDLVICLEVAEHLEAAQAETLIHTLTLHSDCIIFSAAAPGQLGQHHVNCQPPSAWQGRFNDMGFVCDDNVRWRLWDEKSLEPWYRQNMFTARKSVERAAKEPRIKTVIHPDMLSSFCRDLTIQSIEEGAMPAAWYVKASAKAFAAKARRRCGGGSWQ